MKVLLVTGFTPAVENIRGVSAHPYFLLKYRPSDVEVSMITYDINQMGSEYIQQLGKDLSIKIYKVEVPTKIRLLNNRLCNFLSPRGIYDLIMPSKRIKTLIEDVKPDVIWTYPNFFYKWAFVLPKFNFVHSAPDSNVLGCARDFVNTICSQSLLRRIMMNVWYQKSLNNDRMAGNTNSLIHFVGMDDLRMYRKTSNFDNGFFILHPHYILKDKTIHFCKKLNVLIAGKYDMYMKSGVDDIIKVLLSNPYNLINKVSLTFLGKEWESVVSKLNSTGYEARQIKWVDHYIDEIVKYDIQLTPITVGTGTKGKVLDAIGNGLLCVGTKYALENIAVRDKESCILYKDAYEIPAIFNSIYNCPMKYERMAEKGREQIRKYHNPERISKRFFGIISHHLDIKKNR
ncbi:glycosyltransferase [Hallella absiana]|uniref:glycosyltransferase n=1 Tax=Hallella absiana TaxID=2925336 RepID=UPI0021CA566E|nr:glycosyltransferase [Hallella absiana]